MGKVIDRFLESTDDADYFANKWADCERRNTTLPGTPDAVCQLPPPFVLALEQAIRGYGPVFLRSVFPMRSLPPPNVRTMEAENAVYGQVCPRNVVSMHALPPPSVGTLEPAGLLRPVRRTGKLNWGKGQPLLLPFDRQPLLEALLRPRPSRSLDLDVHPCRLAAGFHLKRLTSEFSFR